MIINTNINSNILVPCILPGANLQLKLEGTLPFQWFIVQVRPKKLLELDDNNIDSNAGTGKFRKSELVNRHDNLKFTTCHSENDTVSSEMGLNSGIRMLQQKYLVQLQYQASLELKSPIIFTASFVQSSSVFWNNLTLSLFPCNSSDGNQENNDIDPTPHFKKEENFLIRFSNKFFSCEKYFSTKQSFKIPFIRFILPNFNPNIGRYTCQDDKLFYHTTYTFEEALSLDIEAHNNKLWPEQLSNYLFGLWKGRNVPIPGDGEAGFLEVQSVNVYYNLTAEGPVNNETTTIYNLVDHQSFSPQTTGITFSNDAEINTTQIISTTHEVQTKEITDKNKKDIHVDQDAGGKRNTKNNNHESNQKDSDGEGDIAITNITDQNQSYSLLEIIAWTLLIFSTFTSMFTACYSYKSKCFQKNLLVRWQATFDPERDRHLSQTRPDYKSEHVASIDDYASYFNENGSLGVKPDDSNLSNGHGTASNARSKYRPVCTYYSYKLPRQYVEDVEFLDNFQEKFQSQANESATISTQNRKNTLRPIRSHNKVTPLPSLTDEFIFRKSLTLQQQANINNKLNMHRTSNLNFTDRNVPICRGTQTIKPYLSYRNGPIPTRPATSGRERGNKHVLANKMKLKRSLIDTGENGPCQDRNSTGADILQIDDFYRSGLEIDDGSDEISTYL